VEEEEVPQTVEEALAKPVWKAAMGNELKSMKDTKVYELADLPQGRKAIK
jgi:hypothetical protein